MIGSQASRAGGSADQAKLAKRLPRGHFWFASFRVPEHPIAPSRAMDARWRRDVDLARCSVRDCDLGDEHDVRHRFGGFTVETVVAHIGDRSMPARKGALIPRLILGFTLVADLRFSCSA